LGLTQSRKGEKDLKSQISNLDDPSKPVMLVWMKIALSITSSEYGEVAALGLREAIWSAAAVFRCKQERKHER
jgi:hypothetical protein